jgi:hypothetical protein
MTGSSLNATFFKLKFDELRFNLPASFPNAIFCHASSTRDKHDEMCSKRVLLSLDSGRITHDTVSETLSQVTAHCMYP